jgi:hypothetical protein
MVLSLLSQVALAKAEVVLAADGKAVCSIVLPADALELEQLAARELADHLEKIVGDRPRLVDEPGTGANIYVGRSPAIDRLVADVDFDALGTDGIVMRTVGGDLVLTGGRPRGVLYSVYTFLQDVLGVRWWASDAIHIPSKPALAVGELNVIYRPPFDLRFFSTGPLREDSTWAGRLRHNGFIMGFEVCDHTILKLLPPEEYFLAHPDWYIYTPEDDKNTGDYGYAETIALMARSKLPQPWIDLAVKTRRQPYDVCQSSPGALDAVTAALRRQLEEKYPTWQYPPKIVLVTQNNGAWECKCDACLATTRREGSPSGTWIAFVNTIARRIEKDYPDVLIGVMAFVHTEKPPAHVRPHKNVVVYSIPVSSNRKLPLTEVPQGQWVARWCEIAQHVYIWEHEPNWRNRVQPHPNHFILPQNLRFWSEHGVKAVMVEASGGKANEFIRMRAYVACQLMWDPSQDGRELIIEYLRGYYGDAGPFLLEWIDAQYRAVHREKDFFLNPWVGSTVGWLMLEDLNIGTRLFEKALQAVQGDETLEHRVGLAKLSVDIVWIERHKQLRAAAAEGDRPFLGPDDPLAALDQIDREFGVGAAREFKKVRELLTTDAR